VASATLLIGVNGGGSRTKSEDITMSSHAQVVPAGRHAQIVTTDQEYPDREKASLERWQKAQDKFFKRKKARRYLESKGLCQLLDSSVRLLARNPQNEGRSFEWFLHEGDQLARKLFREALRVG
jgi:hypothetical protein